MRRIYLDHSATTPVRKEVAEIMLEYLTGRFGNPSSIHSFGREAKEALEKAREQVAHALHADSREIIFTSGGTEADNLALLGTALHNSDKGTHIITSAIEHHAVLHACEYLQKLGFRVTVLPVDEYGLIRMEDLRQAITAETILISIMHANNEVGTIQPIAEIGALARERGILFHTDAVQAVGKIPIDLKNTKIDMLSLPGHKLHAPKGIGVLYLRRGCRFRPLLRGGHQERGRRAGTENSASIVGLGMACELAMNNMALENTEVRRLRDKLENGLLSQITHCFPTGDLANRLPNTSNIAFEYIEGEAILLLMNKMGIAGSSGSACTSGSLEPSHVMRAMGIPYTAAHGTIRFSLSVYNTEDEIDRVIAAVPPIVAQLRKLSPYWTDKGPAANPEAAFAPTYA